MLLVAALATGVSSHLFFIAPMMAKLKGKPKSFAANNPVLVPVVSFLITCVMFPVMICILLSENLGKIFSQTIEQSFGEE